MKKLSNSEAELKKSMYSGERNVWEIMLMFLLKNVYTPYKSPVIN